MQPRYVLPAREPGRNISLDTKPKQVDAWLGNLPLSNPVEAAEALADYLATLNSIEVSHDARVKIMDRLGTVLEDIVASLYEQYGTVALPLPPKQQRSAELAQRLLMELAMAYKILLQEWLKRRFHLFGGNPVPLYLQRILLALQAVAEVSYETHQPTPEGIWFDLHQTYNFALRSGLENVIPEGSKMLSLEQIYKATLLMALADPYHLPQAELPWVRDIIARFSNLTSVVPAEEGTKGQAGLFVVDVGMDSTPKPLAREAHPMNPRWDLILNVAGLVKHLTLLSNHLRNPNDRTKLGLPEAAIDPAYASMLKRLRINWGTTVQRQFQRRRHQQGKEVEVCIGFRAMHRLLSPTGSGDTIHYGIVDNDPTPVVVKCKTLNDSMGGLALSKAKANAMQMRVGEIAGIRQDNGNWGLGIVRWFRIPQKGEVAFGIQLLAPQAMAVHLRRKDTGRQWSGLMLQPSSVSKQPPMLAALPGCFGPGLEVEVRTPQGTALIMHLDKRLESSPSLDLLRFDPERAPTPTPLEADV
ncbi:MAG TPA: hypothetical protein PKH69_10310 [Thiobacillaceae bacterium]|nr:hypothetical protein [Thiobacillaceae bacterium]HNU64942.1 hypothetical protein [Thiobacillaceae bacterium]